jgi:hypothetical protein
VTASMSVLIRRLVYLENRILRAIFPLGRNFERNKKNAKNILLV